jgi:putative DNA-invertase from lambdoid prophage Rac
MVGSIVGAVVGPDFSAEYNLYPDRTCWPMIYAYIRVSTDRQSTENQRFEILKYASERRLHIDTWIEETISATKQLSQRQLGTLLARLQADDVLIVTELSRLGRSLLEVMSILHALMEMEATVLTTKEGYEVGNTITAKVLAFAVALSAEIERTMISSRTKEALARKKSEGKRLGRPKGSFAKVTKLTGKEQAIRELLDKRVSYAALARIFGVHRGTVTSFVRRHGLKG